MGETISSSERQELAALCEGRGSVYRLLSRLFEREIDEAFSKHLTSPDTFVSQDDSLTALYAAMVTCLGDGGEEAIENLAVDFDRVFFGMGPLTSEKAFPYESVYTSEGGLMMQDAYAEVKHEYRRSGWQKNPAFSEPEDHIAVELLFMGRCCDEAAAALRDGDEAAAEASLLTQKGFIDAHMLNWIGRFVGDVERATDGLYAKAAELLLAFVRADRALLEEVVS